MSFCRGANVLELRQRTQWLRTRQLRLEPRCTRLGAELERHFDRLAQAALSCAGVSAQARERRFALAELRQVGTLPELFDHVACLLQGLLELGARRRILLRDEHLGQNE